MKKTQKNQEKEENPLNNQESQINRGIELLLRNKRRRDLNPKTFEISFGKMISLFRREFHFFIDFYFDIKKK